MSPERVCKYENHGNDKAVDSQGLDHRQTDKERSRDRRRSIGLLGKGCQSGGNCSAFAKCRAHTADSDGEARCDDRCYRDESVAIHKGSFLVNAPISDRWNSPWLLAELPWAWGQAWQ